MAKKTARPAAKPAGKPSQNRTKEDQWRRRMAQQSQMGASSVVAEPGSDTSVVGGYEDGATQAMSAAPARTAAGSAARRAASSSAVTQRANMAARGARVRLSAATLPLTEEMNYIRGDIRKLIILTAICLVVLIALSFIVPSLIK